jgi:DNA-binding IclR family transcriptional regulator
VGQLEVLLLLRAAADKEWTANEVARAVVTQPPSALGWLRQLVADGLVTQTGERFRYGPRDLAAERAVDQLADSYAKYRVAVVGLIFSKPSEDVRAFSEAFRLRRKG